MTRDRTTRKRRVPREVWTLVAGASVVIVGFLAIPRLINPNDDGAPREAEIVPLPPGLEPPVPPAQAPAGPAPVRVPDTGAPRDRDAAPEPRTVAAAAETAPKDGDLVLEIGLRWKEAAPGTTIPAVLRLRNKGSAAFHLPAAGEAHPTLSLVVLDSEGRVVRRIAETSADPCPRRTTLLRPSGALELPVVVVAGEDQPLAPGEYTVYAELRHDPVWDRLGIPMWREPSGVARSLQEPFTVTAKSE